MAPMAWRDRLPRRGRPRMRRPGRSGAATTVRAADAADEQHLLEFLTTRTGVEGFVEPRTAVSDVTIILIASDGEWTRRRIGGPEVARAFSRDLAIPVYDAQVTGYPQRMRDWSSRQKQNRL